MTDMIEVKTVDLIGPALDWAVGEAIGEKNTISSRFIDNENGAAKLVFWCWNAYSTEWGQGGPLIDEYKPDVGPFNGAISAYLNNRLFDSGPLYSGHGETYLVAACRVIVLFRLGDTVSVPKELMP